MSRSINSDKSWNSTDEEFDDCDHSLTHNAITRRTSGDDIPGACITTHSVGSVIRPGCKMPRNDPLQFVKIQNNDLCKKAVEQIKLAEEVKITKEKIKEVEEEWQNNLLSWKSKRRQSKNSSEDESGTSLASNRKTKTFSEILNEKAKSGQRIGYNLHKYLDGELENENEIRFNFDDNSNDEKTSNDSLNGENDRQMNINNNIMNANNNNNNNNEKHSLGDVIVFDTTLLQEFSYNHKRDDSSDDSSVAEITNNCQQINNKSNNSVENSCNKQSFVEQNNGLINDTNDYKTNESEDLGFDRVRVEIKDWDQHNSQQQRNNVLLYLLKQEQHQQNQRCADEEQNNHHNSSYDAEDDEEDDEELERIRLEQEISFKAKLSAFESLAKQEDYNSAAKQTNNKNKVRDDSRRQPLVLEDSMDTEPQQVVERPVVFSGQYADSEDSEEVMNARIQQLHIERQRAQRPSQQLQHIDPQPQQPSQPLAPNVIYQSYNYNQNPVQQSAPSVQQRQQYEQRPYFMMDEPIGKQNTTTPVRSPQPIRPQPTTVQPLQSTQLPNKQSLQSPQEHLYVNQNQLFNNQTSNPNHNQYFESQKRFGSEYYDSTYDSTQTAQQTPQPIPEPQPNLQHNQPVPTEPTYSSQQNQYLYYPKPYTNKGSKPASIQKPIAVSQQQKPNARTAQTTGAKQGKPQPTPKPHQSGYNQNHWLLQEAELRRQLASIPSQTALPNTVAATHRTTTTASVHKSSPTTPQKGMLSVSGKKKCSSCGDELGRGCAAMVVESLSLYYHINCFRCSVCNIQLGNGTVGTDVRVRNHKLHCQNCYSNDEAGLKFSRV